MAKENKTEIEKIEGALDNLIEQFKSTLYRYEQECIEEHGMPSYIDECAELIRQLTRKNRDISIDEVLKETHKAVFPQLLSEIALCEDQRDCVKLGINRGVRYLANQGRLTHCKTELEGRGEWQPIETAPKDGTEIRVAVEWFTLSDGSKVKVVSQTLIYWISDFGWHCNLLDIDDVTITHWQPLTRPTLAEKLGDE